MSLYRCHQPGLLDCSASVSSCSRSRASTPYSVSRSSTSISRIAFLPSSIRLILDSDARILPAACRAVMPRASRSRRRWDPSRMRRTVGPSEESGTPPTSSSIPDAMRHSVARTAWLTRLILLLRGTAQLRWPGFAVAQSSNDIAYGIPCRLSDPQHYRLISAMAPGAGVTRPGDAHGAAPYPLCMHSQAFVHAQRARSACGARGPWGPAPRRGPRPASRKGDWARGRNCVAITGNSVFFAPIARKLFLRTGLPPISVRGTGLSPNGVRSVRPQAARAGPDVETALRMIQLCAIEPSVTPACSSQW